MQTMAAGMATEGFKPYVGLFNFLQRAYDQIVHDVLSKIEDLLLIELVRLGRMAQLMLVPLTLLIYPLYQTL